MKWSFVFLIVFACVDLPCALGAVLGIDLGGEFVKACVVSPGKSFEILLDETSKRKSPQLVVFDETQRLFGNGGTALSQRKPHLAYSYQKLLLGESLEGPLAQSFNSRSFAHDIVADGGRGTVRSIHTDAQKDKRSEGEDIEQTVDSITSFLPEEITAMTFQYIRKLASKEVGSDVRDTVVTVPSYYTQKQRQAMLNAASIAGLNILSLINENTAAALQYGIDMDYDPEVANLVLFYNIGSTRAEVSLVRYSAYEKRSKLFGQFEVLASATDLELSGQAFDLILTEKFADEFDVQLKKSGEVDADFEVRNVPRTMAKLRKHSQKAKEVLSANKDKMVIIESLYNDIDFRSRITRDELYERSEHLFERILNPIKEVIKKAKIKRTDIAECVLVGGGTRVKKIRDEIESYVGSLSHKLNSDEAPALGAAFRAANISTSFRVRNIGMLDTFSYPIGVRIQDIPDGKTEESLSNLLGKKAFSKRAALFKENNRLEKRKSVAFHHDTDVLITMHYDKGQLLPEGTSTDLGSYVVTGLEDFAKEHEDKGKPKLSLSFELDSNGVVELVRATASYTEEVEVKVPIKPAKTKKDRKKKDKDSKENGAAAEDGGRTEKSTDEGEGEKADSAEKDAEADAEKSEEDEETGDAENAEEEEKDEEPKFEIKIEERETKEALKIERKYPSDFRPLNDEELEVSRNVLQIFDSRDRVTQETSEAHHLVESYIYKARDHSGTDGIEEVATEEQLSSFRSALMDAEDWLYDDGERTAATYKDKLADLQSEGAKIFLRLHEATAFPQAVKEGQKISTKMADLVVQLRDSRPWLKDSDLQTLVNRTANFTVWLEEKIEIQEEVSPFDPPKVTSDMIYKKIDKLRDLATSLSKRPKPADWGKDDKDKDKKGKSKKPTDPEADPEQAEKELFEKFKPGPDGKMTPEQEELIKRFMEQQKDPEYKAEQRERIKKLHEQATQEDPEKREKEAARKEELERATAEAFGTEEGDEDEDDGDHNEL